MYRDTAPVPATIFVTGDMFDSYRLSLNFKEQVVINERFYIKPLLEITGDIRRSGLTRRCTGQPPMRSLRGCR